MSDGRGIDSNSVGDGTADVYAKSTASKSTKYRGLALSYDREDEASFRYLNDQFEKLIQHSIEHCLNHDDVAKRMSEVIGGYQDYQGAMDYIAANLDQAYKDVSDHEAFEKGKRKEDSPIIGNEAALVQAARNVGLLMDGYAPGISDNLDAIRRKLAALKDIRTPYFAQYGADKSKKQLYRKIQGTLKLHEMLLSQMGYFGGSMEFKSGADKDMEFWIYLMSTKTRAPKQGLLTLAPKPIKPYRTTSQTQLPLNNQFSMSKGHAEFTDYDDFPQAETERLDREFAESMQDPGNRAETEKLIERKLTEQDTMASVFHAVSKDENKKKKLFTDIMKLSWSRIPYSDHENPFAPGNQLKSADRLTQSDITDSRIRKPEGTGAVEALGASSDRSHVVGRRANVLITAETAGTEFLEKLGTIPDDDLRAMYGDQTREAITKEAVDATNRWYDQAYGNFKPIYSGPSGHTLGYLTLYDRQLNKLSLEERSGQPSLEEARLVMMASLIGNKEHHTYDEVMYASKGVGAGDHPPGLTYQHPNSYGDLAELAEGDSDLARCVKRAIETARDKVAASFEGPAVEPWKRQVLSRNKEEVLSTVSDVLSVEERCPLARRDPQDGGSPSGQQPAVPQASGSATGTPQISRQHQQRQEQNRDDDEVRIPVGEQIDVREQQDRRQPTEATPLVPRPADDGNQPPAPGLSTGEKVLLGVIGVGAIAGLIYWLTR